jgi:hypothetical protein
LDDLDRSIAHFLRRKRYAIVSESSSNGQELVARFRVHEMFLNDWAGLTGDAIHNLRSALEHLAWQIVDANGGSVGRNIKFPIYRDEADYRSWRTARGRRADPFAGVDPRVISAIEAVQPYQRPNGLDPTDHPLAVLNSFWNTDKHEILIPVIFAIGPPLKMVSGGLMTAPMSWLTRDFEVAEQPTSTPDLPGSRVKDGQVLARFTGRVTGPNPQIEMETDFAFEVCLDDGEVLTDTLINLAAHVVNVVGQLSVLL